MSRQVAPAPFVHLGQGEPVLLIHPFLLNHEVWTEVAHGLSADHEVLAATLPGHWGGPKASWRTLSIEDMADALEEVLDEHGWATCHIVGNSLGGWVAFELERRGRARSVTAIAPAGGWTSISAPAIRLGITFLALAPVMVLARPVAGWAAGVRRIQQAAMSVVAENPAAVPFEVAERAMSAAVRCTSILPIVWSAAWSDGLKGLDQTRTPTQLVLCDKDKVIPWRSYAQMFLDELPGTAEHVMLPEVGHVPMVEDPGMVEVLIRDFVGQHAAAVSAPVEA